jgi:hypothetical protein
MRVLEDTYGFKRVSTGPLPVMEARSLLGGTRGVSLPFTDECPPAVSSLEEFAAAWDNALQMGRDRQWRYLEVRGGKQWLPEAPPSLRFYGHNLDLSGGEEALFARFEGSVRQAVRKAEKRGLKVEKAQDLSALRTYYRLHCGTRKRHGLPPQPWSFFLNIYRHLLSKGIGVLVLARLNQVAVAGAIFFCGRHAVYKFGASDESQQQTRGNNLVMWEGIRWLAAQGSEQLDFGRTSMDNDGLRRFKAGWGTRERIIEYVKYNIQQERFMVDKDRASGWHNQIFRRMPIALLRAAGGVLYRQMT